VHVCEIYVEWSGYMVEVVMDDVNGGNGKI
jgi:hypothetical protein